MTDRKLALSPDLIARLVNQASGMADSIGDGSWIEWTQTQGDEVAATLDALRLMIEKLSGPDLLEAFWRDGWERGRGIDRREVDADEAWGRSVAVRLAREISCNLRTAACAAICETDTL